MTSRWTPELLESKVRELLGESATEDSIPPLMEVSGIYTPPVLPGSTGRAHSRSPAMPVVRPPTPRRLTAKQESDLVNRLYCPKPVIQVPPIPSQSSKPALARLMNPRSAKLAEGLEPIDQRTDKLVRAREKRLERLVAEKETEQAKLITGQPVINMRSRSIAERLTPERRQAIVEQRRQILVKEAQERENQHLTFHPNIGNQQRGIFSVTERLTRDAVGRRTRAASREAARVQELVADCKATPDISLLAKSMSLGAPVHRRLYTRGPAEQAESPNVVAFNDFWSNQRSFVVESKGQSVVQRSPLVDRAVVRESIWNGQRSPLVESRQPIQRPLTADHKPPSPIVRPRPVVRESRRGQRPSSQDKSGIGTTASPSTRGRRLELSDIFKQTYIN